MSKMKSLKKIFLAVFSVLVLLPAFADPGRPLKELVDKLCTNTSFRNSLHIQQDKLLKEFYEKNQYQLQWFKDATSNTKRNDLLNLIADAGEYVLTSNDYHFPFLEELQSKLLKTKEDTLTAEIIHTDAALSFMHDLAYGSYVPYLRHNGLNYEPGCKDFSFILSKALNEDFYKHCISVEPTDNKYIRLKVEYAKLLSIIRQKEFREIKVTGKELNLNNTNLVQRLIQLRYLSATDTSEFRLKVALSKLQQEHNLVIQPKINSYCFEVLNKPISQKLHELEWNIQWFRWLSCIQAKTCVVVNIAGNHLWFFENGIEKICCKMVVGRPATKSPTLTSVISKVIYYPYWNVPYSIATKEMLPELKKNPYYLNGLKIEVLQEGKVIDTAKKINWQLYTAKNFPFELRQKPGCHNSLGLLKFDFPNPFSTYLHDTNNKAAFLAGRRFFSHGCFRVEEPAELAIALGISADKIKVDTCLTDKKPEIFQLATPVPVFIIYATVDVVNGELRWFEDAYKIVRKN